MVYATSMQTPPMKKKVLFLITKSNWGGAQRYVYDLATNLNKDIFDVVVVVGGTGQLTEMLQNQQIRCISLSTLNNSLKPSQVWQTLKDLFMVLKAEKPDILHINSSVAGVLGTVTGRFSRVPRIIFTAHGWAFNEDRPPLQKAFFKFMHWFTVLLTHRTIAVSQAVVNQLDLPGLQNKFKVLHPGRTIGVMYNKTEARENLCSQFDYLEKAKNNIWIGTIGELHKIKQQDVLIESFDKVSRKHPEAKLIIIGKGAEENNLRELIAKLDLKESVFLLGNIHEAARLLKAFDIFALSSRSEAYGYVLHEAGLAHLPVVATKVGGIPEIIENGVSGILVSPNNPTGFGLALEQLLDDEETRKELSTALYIKMSERTLQKMVRATEALYTLN